MPWTATDAKKHTKKANTPHKRKVWSETANAWLRRGNSEGSAIRVANSVVAKMGRR